ncbi:tRNA synthetases class II-domain-containing protein [Pyronema domesticum]|nr:tRNA synthetases class II-domain-containing protein [Pyronema domesticum]
MCILKLYDFRTGPDVLVQAVSTLTPESTEAEKAAHKALFKLPPFVPVAVSGMVAYTTAPLPPPEGSEQEVIDRWGREMPAHRPEIVLKKLIQLNSVDPTLIYTPETVFPPEKRHLQLRTDAKLAAALRLRALVASVARHCLQKMGFLEVETPLLFKSTPEGAREFLVPSRNKGHAYALPQSPQQYKQILMASGVARYFQFAKCFRDEDLRADRQPEFTQLDMEVSFARKEDMMKLIQKLMEVVFFRTMNITLPFGFKRMTYTEAMMSYGTDKPDMRHGYLKIHKVILPNKSETLEAFHIRAGTATLTAMTAIHTQFLTTYKSKYSFRSYIAGESSALGIPDVGLTASDIEAINDRLEISEGDIVILKRRLKPFSGGSTTMGKLRQGLINIAVEHDVISMPEKALEFLWVYDFPLFSPVTSDEPGQGGLAGLASTHHPFTAPHEEDYDLLATDPLKVRAEHYDLVLNGVELGGGSRRIHDAKLQRYILEEVIRVPKERMGQFEHLIKVLDSGCPPHAGIALGFDRLIAMMSDTESIREVIAFPKNSNGVDPLVDSPGKVGEEELAVYGLQLQQQKKERKKKEEKFEYES